MNENLKINQAGVDLIKNCEGLHKKCGEKNGEPLVTTYYCPANVLTIGYGTTGSKVRQGMQITESEAEQFLREDVEKFEQAVKRLVKVELNDNEFSALVSFAYNCGEGNLASSSALKRLNQGDKAGCVEALQWWNKGGGKVLPGLVKRRKAEGDLFLSKAISREDKHELDKAEMAQKVEETSIKLQDIFKQEDLKVDYEVLNDNENHELAVQIQVRLIALGLLNPPADGKFGPLSTQALMDFQRSTQCGEEGFIGKMTAKKLIECKELPQPDIKLGNDLASRIIKYMLAKKYKVFVGKDVYNIVYLEGADEDGTPNANTPNHFNDRRLVIQIGADGVPKIIGNWQGTTEPGRYYTLNPMNPKGAARLAFGQYCAWQVGKHGTSRPHEALVQTGGAVTVCRDFNKDFRREGDKLDTGYFWINQHHGFDYPVNDIVKASAGCLVGRSSAEHQEFMKIIKQDRRYQANPKYIFYSTLIDAKEL